MQVVDGPAKHQRAEQGAGIGSKDEEKADKQGARMATKIGAQAEKRRHTWSVYPRGCPPSALCISLYSGTPARKSAPGLLGHLAPVSSVGRRCAARKCHEP